MESISRKVAQLEATTSKLNTQPSKGITSRSRPKWKHLVPKLAPMKAPSMNIHNNINNEKVGASVHRSLKVTQKKHSIVLMKMRFNTILILSDLRNTPTFGYRG